MSAAFTSADYAREKKGGDEEALNKSWKYFLFLLLIALAIQGFYSMLEMACVSFNRVRLQYYVSRNHMRARLLSNLLSNPAHLFATTLIGANAAMQFGSECARRLYSSMGLNPDWSALSQVLVVLIFAELSPMFAARRYAESVSMLGILPLYFTSIILRPITAILEALSHLINRCCGVIPSSSTLSRDELRCAIEERDDTPHQMRTAGFETVLPNIFSLKSKTARDLMDSLDKSKLVSSSATIEDLRSILGLTVEAFVLIYHKNRTNIVAVAVPRDLLRCSNGAQLRAHARAPWFVTAERSILAIIGEFRHNNQSLAIVLNEEGAAVGILTLNAVVDEIFGQREDWIAFRKFAPKRDQAYVDRCFPGHTKVSDINLWFKLSIPGKEEETLEGLMARLLKHRLDKGESVRLEDVELIVEEASLISGRIILIRSV